MKKFNHSLDTYDFKMGNCKRREPHNRSLFDVTYWLYTYKDLTISIYFDYNDDLGIVGEPYYEIYNVSENGENNFKDTIRYLKKDHVKMIRELEKQAKIHEKELQEYPERFI